jgi:hypothetical protein
VPARKFIKYYETVFKESRRKPAAKQKRAKKK